MRALGFNHFAVAGHDRGGRVAHRMALDHPDAVERIAVLDIAPTATMYAQTNKEFATRYIWWFFLIQPAPLPERLIGADPEFFLRTHIEGQSKTLGSTSEVLFREHLRGCVAWIRDAGAMTPTRTRIRPCGRSSGVPAPACG